MGSRPVDPSLAEYSPLAHWLANFSLVARSLADFSLVARSLAGWSTGLLEPAGRPEPEATCDRALDVLMAGSLFPGWERPSWLAASPKRGTVRRVRTESWAPALAEASNGLGPLSGIALSDEVLFWTELGSPSGPWTAPLALAAFARVSRTPSVRAGPVVSCWLTHGQTTTKGVERSGPPEMGGKGVSKYRDGHANHLCGRHGEAKPPRKDAPGLNYPERNYPGCSGLCWVPPHGD